MAMLKINFTIFVTILIIFKLINMFVSCPNSEEPPNLSAEKLIAQLGELSQMVSAMNNNQIQAEYGNVIVEIVNLCMENVTQPPSPFKSENSDLSKSEEIKQNNYNSASTFSSEDLPTSETAKHKWKNLRDSYIKYMKYLKGSTGSAKKYQNWPWAANLEFLKDTVAPRATTSNVSVSQTHETSFTDEVEQGDSDSGILTPPTQMPPPKKAPKRKEVTDDVHAVINYLENKNNNKTHTKLDHIDHLFLSYAHTFKTFSARTQAILKMEMSQLFGKAELNEFDKHNSTLSSPVFSTTSSWSDVNSNEATDNDTGNDIQAINYSSVYTDGYPREADKITHSRSYPVHTQSAKDMYENVTMFIATQPKHNQ